MARDHEFTFLDHALKCGDSLVGLTSDQISATHWDTTKSPTFVGKLVGDHLREAERGRSRIREQAEWASEAELRPQFKAIETQLEVARLIGDGIVAAFFSADTAKKRIEQLISFQKLVQNNLGSREWHEKAARFSNDLLFGQHPTPPFHWQIEFPEVFSRRDAGFDAIVGNPPFAGKNTIINGNSKNYLPWLQTLHKGAHGNADLVAHFFRRAFELLRQGGVFGLIATNTIGQGDTRSSGLTTIISEGGTIIRARRRLKWPGEAAVVVSVVHVVKGAVPVPTPTLDGRPVTRISAYLVEGDLDTSPEALVANSGKAFQGSILWGMGFTFDDEAADKGTAESIEKMGELIAHDPCNADRVFPFLGWAEVASSPTHTHHRYVIDFFDRPLRREGNLKLWSEMSENERSNCRTTGLVPNDYPDEVAEEWPDLVEIVRRLVKPGRDVQKLDALRNRWWQYGEKRPGLYRAVGALSHVWVTSSQAASQISFARLRTDYVYSSNLNVVAHSGHSIFCLLQSRIHELWARYFGSSMKDDPTYTVKLCFRTFPFPDSFDQNPVLERTGEAYNTLRSQLMVNRNEGLTKTYNRFHARTDNSVDIVHLRAFHAEMDTTVLRAYGWNGNSPGIRAFRSAPWQRSLAGRCSAD